ncbi:MAG: FkbM family methyltransferase [Deltaproteobacteria bacterium]|nr:FkbM family methyltransferase [Deltaproteobacteria bacterium]
MRAKDQMKRGLYQLLKGPGPERIIARAHAATSGLPSSPLQDWLLKLTPHPESYGPDELRRVHRADGDWVFRPANYFQWHHYFQLPDGVLEALVRACRAGDVVLDIGANVGLYAVRMARAVGESGRVYAFEPNPETFAVLEEHARLNRVPQVRPQALAAGAEASTAVLQGIGSDDVGKCSLRSGEAGIAVASVRVVTVDDFYRDQGLERVDLIKVDVEGFEPEALQGAQRTIEAHWPLLCLELSPQWYGGREGMLREAMRWADDSPYSFHEIVDRDIRPFDLAGFLTHLGPDKPQKNVLAVPPARRASLGV